MDATRADSWWGCAEHAQYTRKHARVLQSLLYPMMNNVVLINCLIPGSYVNADRKLVRYQTVIRET